MFLSNQRLGHAPLPKQRENCQASADWWRSIEKEWGRMSKAGESLLRGAREALDYARGAREGFVANVSQN
jgi:hypothetical protein